ncbi:hypothetical protein KIPB_008963, partial [Kipferlia bialata]|eukprot:g8963.t1
MQAKQIFSSSTNVGKIWRAAHTKDKTTKNVWSKIDIAEVATAVTALVEQSLHVRGVLLHGLCVVQGKKSDYLLQIAESALVNMKPKKRRDMSVFNDDDMMNMDNLDELVTGAEASELSMGMDGSLGSVPPGSMGPASMGDMPNLDMNMGMDGLSDMQMTEGLTGLDGLTALDEGLESSDTQSSLLDQGTLIADSTDLPGVHQKGTRKKRAAVPDATVPTPRKRRGGSTHWDDGNNLTPQELQRMVREGPQVSVQLRPLLPVVTNS